MTMAIRISEEERENIINAIKEVIAERYSIPSPYGFKKKMPYPFDSDDGATKYCLIFKKFNFVIKYGNSHSYFKDAFKEVEIYEKAKQRGLEHLFPQTELLLKINDAFFIIQEKIQFSVNDLPTAKMLKNRCSIQKTVSKSIIEVFAKGMEIKNLPCNRYIDRDWLAMCISLYGKKTCKELCKFVHENRINDLHGSNIGYLNNKPVILDFCGWENYKSY